VPVRNPLTVQPSTGTFIAASEVELRESPAADARVVLRAPQGLAMPVLAQSGEFVRVDTGGGRPAWAMRSLGNGARAPAARTALGVMHNSPPMIEPEGAVSLAVRGPSFPLRGLASDEARVLDLYIFVGPNKVFYRSNRDRTGDDARRLPFDATIPLRPGANIVSVIAREDDDSLSRRTFIVRRDGPNGELLNTPQHADDDAEE
jgi:carboxyl-terminal processing protease